jgi:hypothetical protein
MSGESYTEHGAGRRSFLRGLGSAIADGWGYGQTTGTIAARRLNLSRRSSFDELRKNGYVTVLAKP